MDRDQLWDPSHPEPHLHSRAGNGSFLLPTVGAASALLPTVGAASAVVLRPNDHPSSTISNHTAANWGPLHDPYVRLSSVASSSRFPPDHVLGMSQPSFHQLGGGMVNPHGEIGRAAYKRKSPAVFEAFSGDSVSGYYSTGSCSNLQTSSVPLQPKHMVRSQFWPVDSGSIIQSHRSGDLLTASEDFQRNVRSRQNYTIHNEINPAVACSSSNVPHFRAAGTLPSLTMEGQSSHLPMVMTSHGTDPCSNYEASQSRAGPVVIRNTAGAHVVFHPSLTHGRNMSSLPTLRDPIGQGLGAGSIAYNQRSNPHGSNSSYAFGGFANLPLEGDGPPPRIESIASSRYSRPLSIAGRSSHRNGRMRNSYSRFQSGYEAATRSTSEGAIMMDRATYYDSRNWFDQHRDMRLDIDNMSYEELLALEERIGNVSTGLSEETVSSCLQEVSHCSSNQSSEEEEDHCAICLEEYKDQEKIGRLSCRHGFHASCIKNWLFIKNACPICKAAAFSDSPKEKQT